MTTRPLKTNPAYAYLAYRRAIIRDTINFLVSTYVGGGGIDPKRSLVCEEVFACDAEVPSDYIGEYVEELREKEAQVVLEMNKFDFVEKTKDEPKAKKSAGGSKAKGGQTGG